MRYWHTPAGSQRAAEIAEIAEIAERPLRQSAMRRSSEHEEIWGLRGQKCAAWFLVGAHTTGIGGRPMGHREPMRINEPWSASAGALVRRQLVVELKAVERIAPVHVAQLLAYLKFGHLRLGLIVNFNVTELRLGIKRVIKTL